MIYPGIVAVLPPRLLQQLVQEVLLGVFEGFLHRNLQFRPGISLDIHVGIVLLRFLYKFLKRFL